MSKLTADDIVDLGRWHFIQFKDEATAEAAMERYRRYIERQRVKAEAAGELVDGPIDRDDFVDDLDERAA
jgi:hypothetical protein